MDIYAATWAGIACAVCFYAGYKFGYTVAEDNNSVARAKAQLHDAINADLERNRK